MVKEPNMPLTKMPKTILEPISTVSDAKEAQPREHSKSERQQRAQMNRAPRLDYPNPRHIGLVPRIQTSRSSRPIEGTRPIARKIIRGIMEEIIQGAYNIQEVQAAETAERWPR